MPSSSAEKRSIVSVDMMPSIKLAEKNMKKTSQTREYPEEMGTKIPRSATRYPLHRGGQAKWHCQ